MFDNAFFDSLGLMLFMLNPFLLLVYLIDLVEEMSAKNFTKAMIRAAVISTLIYLVFSFVGDAIFNYVFKANFASFKIFGGIIFLITGIKFVFEGNKAITMLKGQPQHIQGGIVMPIMVGPGTISASIITGQRLNPVSSSIVIIGSVVFCIAILILLKRVYNSVKKSNEELLLKYIDIIGRVSALLIGTFSVEMIMSGLKTWLSLT